MRSYLANTCLSGFSPTQPFVSKHKALLFLHLIIQHFLGIYSNFVVVCLIQIRLLGLKVVEVILRLFVLRIWENKKKKLIYQVFLSSRSS